MFVKICALGQNCLNLKTELYEKNAICDFANALPING